MTISLTCPAGIIATLHLSHFLTEEIGILSLSEQISHTGSCIQSHIMPCCIDETHVAVLTPVAPVPGSMSLGSKATGLYLPHIEITAYSRINLSDGNRIGSVHIVIPETIQTDAGQHLRGQF